MNIRLVHWKPAEAQEHIEQLRSAGFSVECDEFSPQLFKQMKQQPPDLFIIDLGRLPSQGRDVALGLRHTKSSRFTPIIFVEGAEAKVVQVRAQVPDAVYTRWEHILKEIPKAIKNKPKNPIVPESSLAGYSGTPLLKKLGIKPGIEVALVNTPNDFEQTLGTLPDSVSISPKLNSQFDLILWFTTKRSELEGQITSISTHLHNKGGLWIIWPKKASGKSTDLTQAVVREIGLANGLVDYKIAAIDATWSGLKFAKRKKA